MSRVWVAPPNATLIMERIASCDLPMSRTGCARVREIKRRVPGSGR